MQGPEPEKTVFFEAQSDATGLARLAPVDPALPVAVSCLARGYARTQQRFDSPPSEVGCALSRLSGLEGKVVDEEGKPLSGATLTLRPDGLSVQSGADGAFSLRDLTAGERKLLVAAPRFKATRREVTVGVAEQKKLDPIELHPSAAVEGRVVDGGPVRLDGVVVDRRAHFPGLTVGGLLVVLGAAVVVVASCAARAGAR